MQLQGAAVALQSRRPQALRLIGHVLGGSISK
nr:MAG TPA: hypothetical protein [Caudoviricetes sp.]